MTGRRDPMRCYQWSDVRHNEVTIRGTLLWWRRYALCIYCGNTRRIKR